MRNRIISFALLTFWLFLIMTILVGCKRKEQPEDAEQAVSADGLRDKPTPEKVVEAGTAGKIDLRILYAGLPNTDRSKDFVDFLTKHFEYVETADYNTFTGDETAGFDVAIVDYDGVEFRAPLPNISRQYARATVTMGVPGAFICSRLSLKTGYL